MLLALVWAIVTSKRAVTVGAEFGRRNIRVSTVALSTLWILVLVGWAYAGWRYWRENSTDSAVLDHRVRDQQLEHLQSELRLNPGDTDGWILLGRSYMAIARFDQAVDAFQHAYDLSHGENVEVMMSLGTALAADDNASLTGHAGELFERSLEIVPDHPKALWYGGLAALQRGDLQLGRDRLQRFLAHNPPPDLYARIEKRIQEVTNQIGDGATGIHGAVGPAQEDKQGLSVSIQIAPEIQKQQRQPRTMFIVAYDLVTAGPPVAIQRRSSMEAPLKVLLGGHDAVLSGHSVASVSRVRVVAFLSNSGAPQLQPGDHYGETIYDPSKDNGDFQIVIDQSF